MVSNQGCLLAGNLAVRLENLTYQSYSHNKIIQQINISHVNY